METIIGIFAIVTVIALFSLHKLLDKHGKLMTDIMQKMLTDQRIEREELYKLIKAETLTEYESLKPPDPPKIKPYNPYEKKLAHDFDTVGVVETEDLQGELYK